jgi:hypothetical protein
MSETFDVQIKKLTASNEEGRILKHAQKKLNRKLREIHEESIALGRIQEKLAEETRSLERALLVSHN